MLADQILYSPTRGCFTCGERLSSRDASLLSHLSAEHGTSPKELGAHLGVGMRNERAVKFYLRYGFKEFQRWNDVLMLEIRL